MSAIPRRLRRAVMARAGNRCEYCRFPSRGQVGPFPTDHIIPRSLGGKTEPANLALACPHCNAHKWAFIEGPDSASAGAAPLFNPRTQVWSAHFRWSNRRPFALEGRTPIGRATIARLQMNHPEMIEARRLIVQSGVQVVDV